MSTRGMRWVTGACILALAMGSSVAAPGLARGADAPADTAYVQKERSPDGTGKHYMGREISIPMGHRGADWLERPDREEEEATSILVRELRLSPGDVVADIGAGTGYFTFRLSPLVPRGKVFAVDIETEMLDIIRSRMAMAEIGNVVPVLGDIDDPGLPRDSVDLVLMVDSYHEFSHPREMMRGILRALKPGGRVVLVEYRAEDPDVPIKPLHKMSEAQARAEMEAAGLEWIETRDVLPRQHFMVFAKPPGNRK